MEIGDAQNPDLGKQDVRHIIVVDPLAFSGQLAEESMKAVHVLIAPT